MADLLEENEWTPGIYQLETSDPVLGGPDGIDNLQAKQLASRTGWLKAQVALLGEGKQPLDATLTALAGLILADDKLIYATGVDTFATTALSSFIRSLLGNVDAAAARTTLGAAPLASPALTGTPTAPTAPLGTNTLQLATTAFVQAAAAALVNSSPAALDTLNELATALGNDPNFATTITNLLALKAPLASPNFTGSPTAPTPVQFGNGPGLATTEFVQRALGNFKSAVQYNTSQALTAAMVGQAIQAYGTSALTFTLPLVAGPPDGGSYFVANGTNKTLTLQVSGGDPMYSGNSGIISTLAIPSGSSVTITKINAQWFVCGPGALFNDAQFGSSLAGPTCYQKLPSGDIEQWGLYSGAPSGSDSVITLPVAMLALPTSIEFTYADFSVGAAVGQAPVFQARNSTNGSITVRNLYGSTSAFFWRVRGKV